MRGGVAEVVLEAYAIPISISTGSMINAWYSSGDYGDTEDHSDRTAPQLCHCNGHRTDNDKPERMTIDPMFGAVNLEIGISYEQVIRSNFCLNLLNLCFKSLN